MKTEDPAGDLNRQLDAYAVANSPKRAHHSRLGSWPVYAAATGAALAGATAASADIIYSGPINLSGTSVRFVPEKGNTIGFSDDLVIFRHFVSSTTSHGRHIPSENLVNEFARIGGNISRSGSLAQNFPTGAPILGTHVRSGGYLAAVQEIGTHQGHTVYSAAGSARGKFGSGFLGVELFKTTGQHGAPTGPPQLGWVQVRFDDGVFPGVFHITGWAYNTDGPINAGETGATAPEPGYFPLMLLAAGAAGVLAWKRHRSTGSPQPIGCDAGETGHCAESDLT